MLNDTLRSLYKRDLEKLRAELLAYREEDNIWKVAGKLPNSAGNLSLHLIGNLNTYVSSILGGKDYVRDRPAEFALKHVPRNELVAAIDDTVRSVDGALAALDPDQLKAIYPQDVGKGEITTEFFLVHLAMHLSYHLGQVNYHRRLLDA